MKRSKFIEYRSPRDAECGAVRIGLESRVRKAWMFKYFLRGMGVLLNSRRAASPLARLVEGEVSWSHGNNTLLVTDLSSVTRASERNTLAITPFPKFPHHTNVRILNRDRFNVHQPSTWRFFNDIRTQTHDHDHSATTVTSFKRTYIN
ncbi:hypothetical protein TNCV_3218941 [Trichonephila clavipes]|nr:hypothetical protein TNCV_3218941 [Trichonephila clavipes]